MNAFHMKIEVREVDQKDKNKPDRADKENQSLMQSSSMTVAKVTDNDIPPKYRALNWDNVQYQEYVEKQANNYYPSLFFIMTELLGGGYAKMFDQARGLRNIINNLMLDPRIANLLCADEANMLDFDRMLFNNEVTVINTALEFGSQSSTALGVFIILNLKLAVMRRASIPEKERTNHFIYIDEASQYMHPVYEDMFALFRQYRVAVTLALQSQTQMDKTPVTKYLRGVIRGAGTHIVFGRADSEEMKYYEELMGMEKHEIIQTQVNSNSEFDDNYSVTKGQRVTMQEEAAVSASQIRIRDFQEVTMLMIDRGRVLKGFIGKVRFPSKKSYKPQPHANDIDFSEFVPHAKSTPAQGSGELATKGMIPGRDAVEGYKRSISSTERQDAYTRAGQSLVDENTAPRQGMAVRDEVRERVGSSEAYKSMISSDLFPAVQEEAQGVEPLRTGMQNAESPLRFTPQNDTAAEQRPQEVPPEEREEDIDLSAFAIGARETEEEDLDELDEAGMIDLLKSLNQEGGSIRLG